MVPASLRQEITQQDNRYTPLRLPPQPQRLRLKHYLYKHLVLIGQVLLHKVSVLQAGRRSRLRLTPPPNIFSHIIYFSYLCGRKKKQFLWQRKRYPKRQKNIIPTGSRATGMSCIATARCIDCQLRTATAGLSAPHRKNWRQNSSKHWSVANCITRQNP